MSRIAVLFAAISIALVSTFIGMPYFIDPIKAATFEESHVAIGLLQAWGFALAGWGARIFWSEHR